MFIQAKNIRFSYNSVDVLKDVSFYIEKGDLIAILGNNGAGKSTLIKCINRILKPKFGTILIEGQDVEKLGSEIAKKVSYVSQRNQVTRLTVFDAVLLGRKPYVTWGISKKDLEITKGVIEMLSLQKISMRFVDELSGGELQKVIVARALVQEPLLILLDEPTNNLDIKSQIEVMNIVRQIVQDKKISALMAIHDINLALRFIDKFILMKDGKIFSSGGLEIITEENFSEVFGVMVKIKNIDGRPFLIF
ncbi:MAG TPA: ABC transporter ATP-binding protein [Thermodesulfobium narugense]|uniref:Iron complex transport system ATP-binding protein n=1 Tax=Thermodesulfobium acidiphilum TaxID=1794699 RepID=A0A2R4W1K5_THEAF|nr:ABC transporter ATP-binding protein [Thermodesulfobium acidiphilum]AWB10697.1 iron complex transport system ATP-binding protein [Thermodesulfobium acidiphilum]PMP85877.1 MAG: iron ABC transporter ATP-binding protein [Thermodesulfobium narugense]HEM55302.1 ABC transporter ATP-binding protein [Thermodesulfobium narugense]